MKHCRGEYTPHEQRNTCINCAHPLSDNQLVKDAFKVNNNVSWAKNQLRILYYMASDRNLPIWVTDEIKRISNGLTNLD